MQDILYSDFGHIFEDSRRAYQYAEAHFEELMDRTVSHILYGPPAYGPGAIFPSQRMITDKKRILKNKTRRARFKAYYFDANWDLLYSRDYGKNGLCCTILHFWLNNVNYARFFLRDTNQFYSAPVFSVKYENHKPIRCAVASSSRIYVEYISYNTDKTGKVLAEYNWYDYYPYREFSENGTPLLKSAPFGADNSPVSCGNAIFESLNIDFSRQ